MAFEKLARITFKPETGFVSEIAENEHTQALRGWVDEIFYNNPLLKAASTNPSFTFYAQILHDGKYEKSVFESNYGFWEGPIHQHADLLTKPYILPS